MTVSRDMSEMEIRDRRQILTEQKNLAAVMNVDLEKYWEDSA